MPIIRILVVDDFLPWQHYVLTLLESETDLKIISVASNGLEAVQKAQELQPDVILMNGSLPGVNGFEATREIRMLSPGSKVLFLTSHPDSYLIQAAFEIGSSGYVLKPDSRSDLIRGIRAVLLGQEFVSHSLNHWRRSSSARFKVVY